LKVAFAASVVAALTLAGVAAAAQGDPKKVILPAVQAKAKAINVRIGDLGTGPWKAKPSSQNQSTVPRCSYYNPDQSDLTENGDAESPEFTLSSGSFVASTTGIFATAAQGRTGYARVVRPALPKCLGEVFRKGSGHPDKVTIVSATPIGFPKLADRTNAYRVTADLAVSAKVTVQVYLDVVTMNRGKADVAIFFAGIGQAFSSSFEKSVAGKIAARMKRV
jgi:hypothetical protein